MSTSRETCDLFFYLKRKDWKGFKRHLRQFNKITYKDTFMPFICWLSGHKPYVTISSGDEIYDTYIKDFSYACKRCNKYIKNYNHQLPGLSFEDTLFFEYIKKDFCNHGEIDYEIINGNLIYIKFQKFLPTYWKFDEYKQHFLHKIKDYLKSRLIYFKFDLLPHNPDKINVKFSFIPFYYSQDYEMMVSYKEQEDIEFNKKFNKLIEENELKLSYKIQENNENL